MTLVVQHAWERWRNYLDKCNFNQQANNVWNTIKSLTNNFNGETLKNNKLCANEFHKPFTPHPHLRDKLKNKVLRRIQKRRVFSLLLCNRYLKNMPEPPRDIELITYPDDCSILTKGNHIPISLVSQTQQISAWRYYLVVSDTSAQLTNYEWAENQVLTINPPWTTHPADLGNMTDLLKKLRKERKVRGSSYIFLPTGFIQFLSLRWT